MEKLPKLVKAASMLAFFMAGLTALGAALGPIVTLPLALPPLFAAVGMRRGRVWSALGFGIYLVGQLLLLPVLLLRPGAATSVALPQFAATAVGGGLMGTIFLFAGRSLRRAGGQRGRATPWLVLLALTTLPLLFVQAFVIPTGSMENTLLLGDRILVQLFPRAVPVRDEVVVHVYPVDRRQTFVKRIIGAPGDRIRISAKKLYRNGVELKEAYAIHRTEYLDSYRDNFPSEPNFPVFPQTLDMLQHHTVHGEVVVPPGKYFVLGDNRDQSLDSRYWGFISEADVIGKPWIVYDSQPESGPRRWDRIFRRL